MQANMSTSANGCARGYRSWRPSVCMYKRKRLYIHVKYHYYAQEGLKRQGYYVGGSMNCRVRVRMYM